MLAGVVLVGQILGEIRLLAQPVQPSGVEVFSLAVGLTMVAFRGSACRSGYPAWMIQGKRGC